VGRAIPIYQQTDAERVLGPDHPQHPHLSKQSGRRYRGNEILKIILEGRAFIMISRWTSREATA
jgi:hypothetical protein